MFDRKNPFAAKQGPVSRRTDAEASQKTCADLQESLKESPANDDKTDRRIKQILETCKAPEMLFLGIKKSGGAIAVIPNGSQTPVLLMFSSPAQATDYIRHQRVDAQVGAFKTADAPQVVQNWRRAGIASFALDVCPRCAIMNAVPIPEAGFTQQQLFSLWAIARAIREARGEVIVRKLFADESQDTSEEKCASLEFLRDHVDCSVPYVHWVIGIYAGAQGDETAKANAAARLDEFGPEFAGKLALGTDPGEQSAWSDAVAKAHLGLLRTYGLLDLAKKSLNPGLPIERLN